MLFDVRTDEVGPWTVVRVVGEVDLASLPEVRSALDRVDAERVALDLSAVDYLDPVALGVVLAGRLRARRRGGRFVVVSPPGRPRELLAEAGVDTLVQVLDGITALDGPSAGP